MWSVGAGGDVMKRIAAPMIGGILTSFLMELVIYPCPGSFLLGTATPLAPLRQLCPVLEDRGLSPLFPDAPRTDHAGKRVDRTILLLGHPIFLPQVPLPKPPGCFFLPLPPCLPQSDNCSLYFAAVACPPPEAMHRGQISFV